MKYYIVKDGYLVGNGYGAIPVNDTTVQYYRDLPDWVQPYIKNTTYADLRKNEYPLIADQLDALWKGGEALEQMRQQILLIKEKYPKEQTNDTN
jgi:hypothetical protein